MDPTTQSGRRRGLDRQDKTHQSHLGAPSSTVSRRSASSGRREKLPPSKPPLPAPPVHTSPLPPLPSPRAAHVGSRRLPPGSFGADLHIAIAPRRPCRDHPRSFGLQPSVASPHVLHAKRCRTSFTRSDVAARADISKRLHVEQPTRCAAATPPAARRRRLPLAVGVRRLEEARPSGGARAERVRTGPPRVCLVCVGA